MKNWTLQKVWNESFENGEREYPPRDYMWASELGRSDIDIFLKMMGEKPTNPPNDRSFRKFEVGNLFEWIVKIILIRCGIYKSSQDRVEGQIENCVRVSGRLDYIAGGKPDWDKAKAMIAELQLPDFLKSRAEKTIDYFQANYPEGLDEKILEIKSVALIGFNKIEKTGKAVAGHDIQLFHYAHNKNQEGALIYICRDDLRMFEIPILPNDQNLLKRYQEKIERVSAHYKEKQIPEPEPMILFDGDFGKFTKNLNVEYSPFLSKIYGIERPDMYDAEVKPVIGRWNRVLGRIKANKPLTKDNQTAIGEMTGRGFNVDEITSIIKKSSEVGEDEISEDE